MKFHILFIIMILSTLHNLHAMLFSYEDILRATNQLTQQEKIYLKNYLTAQVSQATNNVHHETFKNMLNQFSAGDYTAILKKLTALGQSPASILHVTPLRISFIEGSISHLLWFVREIVALDWFFEQKDFLWPTPTDKILYIIGLVNQLERNYTRINNLQLLQDITTILSTHLQAVRTHANPIVQRAIDQSFAKLAMINAIFPRLN